MCRGAVGRRQKRQGWPAPRGCSAGATAPSRTALPVTPSRQPPPRRLPAEEAALAPLGACHHVAGLTREGQRAFVTADQRDARRARVARDRHPIRLARHEAHRLPRRARVVPPAQPTLRQRLLEARRVQPRLLLALRARAEIHPDLLVLRLLRLRHRGPDHRPSATPLPAPRTPAARRRPKTPRLREKSGWDRSSKQR